MFNLFKKSQQMGNSQTVILKINGMHCVACSLSIDTELEDVSGVISSTTSYPKSETIVTFDPSQVNINVIKKVIHQVGYTTP